ncbi:unnamed protein product [Boreogadus saida]
MVRIQELLLTLQPGAGGAVADIRPDPSLGDVPGTDDVLSLAASANLFSEGHGGGSLKRFWGGLPRLCLELWAQHRGARALAAMRDPAQYGLGRMPPVEPAIASLILTPDQALRPDARCPRPQCRVTDDLLSKAYDAAARMGRIGNSLSHLMLALSTSLQQAAVEPSTQHLSDASLQAFALMSSELGRVMSTLVQTRRQVWLAQSPLTEACRKALRAVPVVPGELFGAGRSLLFIQFLQLLGKLAAASAVVPLGLLSLRPLQMWLNSLPLDAKWHRQRRVKGPTHC